MKTTIYTHYVTRSLLRGGQRTVLAILCVAVGVMAIVALQLVGQMIALALANNAREVNGGDVQVATQYVSLQETDLAFFNRLKQQGTITSYTPTIDLNGQTFVGTTRKAFSVIAVDPTNYPVIPALTFKTPADGWLPALLQQGRVVIDQGLADQAHLHSGDSFTLHLINAGLPARTLGVTIAAIVTDSGVFAQKSNFLLLSLAEYRQANAGQPLAYTHVYISTEQNQARTDVANRAIQNAFPLLNTSTTADQLKNQQDNTALIQKFMDIAGLLALLVGGVGILNTMQVLLARRRIEIATLKTCGYRRLDLYLLFGLEAALLGFLGGTLGGILAIGASVLVRALVQNFFATLSAPFVLDWSLIGGGILIGIATTLIFSLLPIVQAASIRPLSVLREGTGDVRRRGAPSRVALLFLLSLLFCLLAVLILNDLLWGVLAVYSGFAFLGLLGLLFSLVGPMIGKLPVPASYSVRHLMLVLLNMIIGGLLCFASPSLGGLLLVAALGGAVVVLLPRAWKVNIKLALRNIGRQRTRTTTMLLAVFVGVFTIGLITNTGENIINQISAQRSRASAFNIVVFTNQQYGRLVSQQAHTVPGLAPGSLQQRDYTDVIPLSVDGQPLEHLLPPHDPNFQSSVHGFNRDDVIHMLNSFEGYDVAHGQLPAVKDGVSITEGRSLAPADAGTDNILLQWDVVHLQAFRGKIKVGSELLVSSQDGKVHKRLHVVGVFNPKGFSYIGKVMAPAELVQSLAPAQQPRTISYMSIDSKQIEHAIDRISEIAPNAEIRNYAAFGDQITQLFSNSIILASGIAALSLLAAVILIANAVALAMLERRREVGILKAVGYTSRMILSEIVIENGIVAGAGAWLAMLTVALFNLPLGIYLSFSTQVNWYLVLGIIPGIALLAILTAIVVAWQPARIHPLDVLRYE